MNGLYSPSYDIEYCLYELKLVVTKGRRKAIEFANFANSNNVETVQHFLFDCDLYATERTDFINRVRHNNNNWDNLSHFAQLSYLFDEKPRMLGKFVKIIVETRKRTLYRYM